MPTIEELADKYSGDSTAPLKVTVNPISTSTNIDELAAKYGGGNEIKTAPVSDGKSVTENLIGGFKKGLTNVINTGGQAIGAIDRTVGGEAGQARSKAFNERVAKENTDYQQNYGDSTAAEIGKVGGEVLATAPLVPAKAVQGINLAARALPTALSTGERIAAPLINRLGAAVGIGGVGGATYGAATSSGNDNSLGENITANAIGGAIAGPAVTVASKLGAATIPHLWANLDLSKIAYAASIPVSVAKNIIGRLEDAGLTPKDAQVALTKMGPKATLMDLDRSLATEGSGVAALGGKNTTILKGRMDARGETANNDAVKIFENKFGAKPNLEGEKEAVHTEATILTKADYDLAHNSTQNLDISGTVQHIDDALINAVGTKASILKEVKGYLFKTVKDSQGNEVKVLKNDVASLHEARQGIDDIINKKGDGLPPNAKRAISTVRDKIDEALKTNPEMAAADEKFAAKMNVKNGLDFGYNMITKGGMNKEEFIKAFDASEPEVKEAIKKGLRAATGDLMEKSTQGQLTGAERLFGKKDVNRSIFKHAFGNDAEDVLDEIHKSIMFRNTERGITGGAQTAERQAVRNRYESQNSGGGVVSDTLKGLAVDLSTGSSGGASSMMAGRRLGSNVLLKMSESKLGRLTEGTADILSQQGAEINRTLSTLDRVTKVQAKLNKSTYKQPKLPITLSAPIGEKSYKQYKKLGY